MTKRGRPKKNGVKPIWMLVRTVMILLVYDQARRSGEKHSAAVEAAVAAVRSQVPGMPISNTEVRRVLAEVRSQHSEEALIVTKNVTEEQEIDSFLRGLEWAARESRGRWGVPSFPNPSRSSQIRAVVLQLGPRPQYPRRNARTRPPTRNR